MNMGHIVGSSIKDQIYDLYDDYDSVITEEGGLCSKLLNRCGLPNYVGGDFGNFDDDSAASFLEYVGYKRIDLKETIDNSYDEEVTKTHDVWKKDGGYLGEIDSDNNITLRETGHYVTEEYTETVHHEVLDSNHLTCYCYKSKGKKLSLEDFDLFFQSIREYFIFYCNNLMVIKKNGYFYNVKSGRLNKNRLTDKSVHRLAYLGCAKFYILLAIWFLTFLAALLLGIYGAANLFFVMYVMYGFIICGFIVFVINYTWKDKEWEDHFITNWKFDLFLFIVFVHCALPICFSESVIAISCYTAFLFLLNFIFILYYLFQKRDDCECIYRNFRHARDYIRKNDITCWKGYHQLIHKIIEEKLG